MPKVCDNFDITSSISPLADATCKKLYILSSHNNFLLLISCEIIIIIYFSDRLSKDEIPYLYPQVRGILNALKEKGVEMAIASRASRRGVAKTFLEILGIHIMFGAQVRSLCSATL
jgi:hypothetical protein